MKEGETRDPICGKPIDPLRARAVGIFGGVTYYFCSPECKAQFRDPRELIPGDYIGPERRSQAEPPAQATAAEEELPIDDSSTGPIAAEMMGRDATQTQAKPSRHFARYFFTVVIAIAALAYFAASYLRR